MATQILGTLAVKLQAKIAGFKAQMARATASVEKHKKAIMAVGIASGIAFAGMARAISGAVATFAKFETKLVKTAAIIGTSGGEMGELENRARSLARTTQFSATEVAGAMQFLAQAGAGFEGTMAAIEPTLTLAAAGMIDVARAADITTNVMAAFGLETDQLAMAGDIMISAATGANTSLEQLGEAFKFVGPVAESVGHSLEETTAAMALMGNVGIQSTMAGTAMRGAIVRLIKPSGEAAGVIARLGLRVKTSSGKLVSMVSVIKQLETSGAKTADIMTLFGLRAGPAMAGLLKQGSEKLAEFTDRLRKSGGTAALIMKKVSETFAFQTAILKSNFEEVQIAIGQALTPALLKINSLFILLLDIFNNLSPQTKKWIAFIAAGGTALLGVVAVVSAFALVLPSLVAGFGLLAGILSGVTLASIAGLLVPLALVAGAVVVGIAIIGLFKDTWETDLNKLKIFIDDWAGKVQKVFDALNPGKALMNVIRSVDAVVFGGALGSAADKGGNKIEELKSEAIKAFVDRVKDGITALGEMTGATDAAGGMIKRVKKILKEMAGEVKKAGVAIAEVAKTIKESVFEKTIRDNLIPNLQAMDKAFVKAGEAFITGAAQISGETKARTGVDVSGGSIALEGEAVKKGFVTAGVAIREGVATFANDLKGELGNVGKVIDGAMSGLQSGGPIGAIIGAIVAILFQTENFKKVVELANEALSDFVNAFNELLDGFVSIGQQMNKSLKPIFEALGEIFGAIGDIFENLLSPVISKVIAIVAGILTPILKVFASVLRIIAAVVGVFMEIGQGLAGVGPIFDLIMLALEGFGIAMQAVADAFDEAGAWFEKAAQDIGDFFTDLFNGSLFGNGMRTGMKRQISDRIQKEHIAGMQQEAEARKNAATGIEVASKTMDGVNMSLVDVDESLTDFGKTIEDVNEALSNVPEGFKVALARFNATDVGGDEEGGSGRGGSTVIINSNDAQHTWNQMQEISEFEEFTQSGSIIQRSGQFATDRKGS